MDLAYTTALTVILALFSAVYISEWDFHGRDQWDGDRAEEDEEARNDD